MKAFAGVRIHHNGCDGNVVPSPHGTAVADLLVGRNAVGEIFAADVYCGEAAGGAVDAVSAAFGWMARERVAVINVSLVGPRNKLMERVVKTLVSRGHLIVAAVGNDGPAAPPLYPASYDGVIGVTAVDGKHHVLIEACRGKQVDFAGARRGHPGGCRRAEYLRARARHFVRRADHRNDVRHGSGNTRSGAGGNRAREVERNRERSRQARARRRLRRGRTWRLPDSVLGNSHK
jgi:subtilisin family serine protease